MNEKLTSSAVHVGRHLDSHVEVHSLGLGETVGTRHIVCHLERNLAGSTQRVASGVHVALALIVSFCIMGIRCFHNEVSYCVRAGTVSVDLVDRDSHLSTGRDLGNSIGGEGVLGVLPNVDVSAKLSTSTLVYDVRGDLGITDDGGILLAGADARAVPCKIALD